MKNTINLTRDKAQTNKRSWIFEMIEIIVRLFCEICIACGVLYAVIDVMPGIYETLIDNNVDEGLASAFVAVTIIIVLVFVYRMYDLLTNIVKDGAENDLNNQKTRSSSNEPAHEHHA